MSRRLFPILPYFLAACLLASPLAAHSGRDVERLLREQGARAKANAELYYDEVFDANGELRPQYRDIYPRLLRKSEAELRKIRRLTSADMRGDNALSAFALITDEKEKELKRRGVDQRGRALLEFLKDHYSGRKTYARVIAPALVDQIIERTGESGYAGHLNPDLISFMYGPDVIRGRDGKFYVLEDNTNYLGGQGDLVDARRSLWKRVPDYAEALRGEKLRDPLDFYRNLLARYRAQLRSPEDKIIFFAVPPYPDNEDGRLIRIWKGLGVETVTPYTRNPKLVKRPDGMYLERRNGGVIRREKVGFMVMNAEFGGLDPTFAPSREQRLLEVAREQLAENGKLSAAKRAALERALTPHAITGRIDVDALENVLRKKLGLGRFTAGSVPGLVEAIVRGQVLANNTPGVDFINDKELNIYVEDLIRHYLREEPILRNIPARRLYRTNAGGARVPDEEVFRELAEHREKYVVKVVDGRGGEGVSVGPKESPEKWRAMLEERRANVEREAISQGYLHPSVVNGDITDERILAQVGPPVRGKYVEVSPTGWSRGVSMDGDGKVNLSQGKAHELVVFERDVESLRSPPAPGPGPCPGLYRAVAPPR